VTEPADWNDIAGWDRHHVETSVAERIAAARRALRYVPDLEANRLKRVWFPGCGTSFAPRSYAELGFDVTASDLSREALDVQWQSKQASGDLLRMLYEQAVSGLAPERGGAFRTQKHDLRSPWEGPPFDCVLNIRALSGFDAKTRTAIAASQLGALRPGGWAIFETSGVGPDARDALEEVLLGAGATLPLHACERWYRQALRDTGLPVTFVLGHPRVLASEEHVEQPGEQEQLDEIERAYLARRREERAREGPPPPEARLAFVLYD
jgi:hypothetical protein